MQIDSGVPLWGKLHYVTGTLVNVSLLIAAAAALIKFRLLNALGRRWRSELNCTHWDMRDGSVVFAADYTVHNTGPRLLRVTRVNLRLVGSKIDDAILAPNEAEILAERTLLPSDPALRGLFWIESGERTIFTLRCRIREFPETVFILSTFELAHRRVPAAFRGFYCHASKAVTEAALGHESSYFNKVTKEHPRSAASVGS